MKRDLFKWFQAAACSTYNGCIRCPFYIAQTENKTNKYHCAFEQVVRGMDNSNLDRVVDKFLEKELEKLENMRKTVKEV